MKVKKMLFFQLLTIVALQSLAGMAFAESAAVEGIATASEFSTAITGIVLIVFAIQLWDVLRGSNFASLWGWLLLVGVFTASYGINELALQGEFRVPIIVTSALLQFLSITGVLITIILGQRKSVRS